MVFIVIQFDFSGAHRFFKGVFMTKEILIVLSFVIGIICIKYLRTFDRHEREPFWKMFAVTCWGGAWSIIISFFLYTFLYIIGFHELENAFGALFIIGPVEELAKLLALFSSWFIIREELNEPTDGIIYMACVALGFSLIENYTYATNSASSSYLLFVRLFIATPMHIAFSIFMGLAFYIRKKYHKAMTVFFIPFVYACLVHGIYDSIIFHSLSLLFLLVIIHFAHSFSLSLLSFTTAQSPFRLSFAESMERYVPKREKGLECLHCGSSNEKETYTLKKAVLQKCDTCEHYVTTKQGLVTLFHDFASTFRKIKKHYLPPSQTGKEYSILYANNFIFEKKKLAYFNLEKLNETLESVNKRIIEDMQGKWWFPQSISAPDAILQEVDYHENFTRASEIIGRWLIFPFSEDRGKKIHRLVEPGPPWNWGAFFFPELWFLYHEMWGIFFLISGLYGMLVFLAMTGILTWSFHGILVFLLIIRLIAGRSGNSIYYIRHGKWPEGTEQKADVELEQNSQIQPWREARNTVSAKKQAGS